MPSTSFSQRFVFDSGFYSDFKEGKLEAKPSLLIQLMRINDRSTEHKDRTQNVMSKKTFNAVLTQRVKERLDEQKEGEQLPNIEKLRGLLRGSFFDIDIPELEKITDETERTIKLAINLTDKFPNQSIIFTSEKNKPVYEKNVHFLGVKQISVKSKEEVVAIINGAFSQCTGK